MPCEGCHVWPFWVEGASGDRPCWSGLLLCACWQKDKITELLREDRFTDLKHSIQLSLTRLRIRGMLPYFSTKY